MASKPKKTYKRETAWVLLGIIGYTVFVGNSSILEIIIWPFMFFIAAAYGMDWATKQTEFTRGNGFGWGEKKTEYEFTQGGE